MSEDHRNITIERLNAVAPKVAAHLFPEGVRLGNEWSIGDIEGSPGQSLKICVEGSKVGFWKDWASEEKGGANLVDLWAKARNLKFWEALDEAKAWLDSDGENGAPPAAAATSPKTTTSKSRPSAAPEEKPFDWPKCIEKATTKRLQQVAVERGLSFEFVHWLREYGLLGFYGENVAFPIDSEEGDPVGIHTRTKNRAWRVVGGCKMRPFVIGDTAKAKVIFVFESQWDAFAILDRLRLMDQPDDATIITRGAANGKLVAGLIPKGTKVLAFKQNDVADEKGRKAADEWLVSVAHHAGTPVHVVPTPLAWKDANDWTRAGATKEEIEAAIAAAMVVEVTAEEAPPPHPPAKATSEAVKPTPLAESFSPPLPDCYYEPSQRQCWFIPNAAGAHVSVNDAGLKRYLKSQGFDPKVPDGQFLSPLDATILKLHQQHELAYAGPLAGEHAGIRRMQGNLILVTSSPTIITPAPGEWPVVSSLIDNLLVENHPAQKEHFFGWLKVAFNALRNGERRPGQALVLAGPADCGKSLLQKLLTEILGGRSAKPYQFMTGGTTFNRDLFTAEHLMVEDDVPSADYRSRRNFGTNIKGVTVNTGQRMHQKFRDAIVLEPFWRLTISLNDEPENLMVLPPIDDSIGDKIILLRCSRKPMPMPADNDAQRRKFWETMVAELPALLHWLDQWTIPEELRDQRYGVRHFHHPDLLQAIDDLSPEMRLLGLIDDELFGSFGPGTVGPWTGTARQLERKLTDASSADSREARRLFSFNTACGTYLARLEQKYPRRVNSRTKKGFRHWTIMPPVEATEATTEHNE